MLLTISTSGVAIFGASLIWNQTACINNGSLIVLQHPKQCYLQILEIGVVKMYILNSVISVDMLLTNIGDWCCQKCIQFSDFC